MLRNSNDVDAGNPELESSLESIPRGAEYDWFCSPRLSHSLYSSGLIGQHSDNGRQ